MTTDSELRIAAVSAAAVITAAQHGCHHDVLETATRLYDWLNTPPPAVRMTLTASAPVPQTTPGSTTEGNTMQLHDTEEFTLSVAETDAKGQPVTTDTITWTVADPTVATLQVAADTYSAVVVAGNVGSTVVTLTDGTITATEAVDVIAGVATAIVLNEGPAVPQTPAAGAPGTPAA
jgi:hypothetical protein